MENQSNVQCPNCGSTNVVVHTRGYSFIQGLILGVVLVLLDWAYTIFTNASAFQAMDEYGQTGFTIGLLLKSVPIFIFGLLLGLIGKNKLVARCLKCKHKFDPTMIDKWGEKPEEEPVQVSRGEGSVSPTKSDVREFHDKIAKYKKEHKVVDEKWLENLVKEYNAKFSEDFHQYL